MVHVAILVLVILIILIYIPTANFVVLRAVSHFVILWVGIGMKVVLVIIQMGLD